MLVPAPKPPTGPQGEPWVPAIREGPPTRPAVAKLNLQDTMFYGRRLLDAFMSDDIAFRWGYYTISRTWHEKQSGGLAGGEFGEQYSRLIENELRLPLGTLGLADFANLHAYAFFSARRAVIAMTTGDIDPDAPDDPNHPHPPLGTESYHWPPNDSSFTTYSLTDMKLDPTKV